MHRFQRDADAFDSPLFQAETVIEEERSAVLETRAALAKTFHTYLWSLQIPEQSDVAALVERRLLERCRPAAMLIGAAVREVDSRDVEAGADHLAEYFGPL